MDGPGHTLVIGPAAAGDIPQLADLLVLLFTQEADFIPDREKQMRGLERLLAAPALGQVFTARLDDHIVGMVSLLFTISTAEGGLACWLEDMIVHPGYRGAGIGSRLLRHAVEYARENGFVRIMLLTDAGNEGARRFYERQCFRRSAMSVMRLSLAGHEAEDNREDRT